MRYTVETKLQDEEWKLLSERSSLREAVTSLTDYIKTPMGGVARLIEYRGELGAVKILIELPAKGVKKMSDPTPREIADMDQSFKLYNDHMIPQWRAMYLKLIEEGFTETQSLEILMSYTNSVILAAS